ncbi:hypothetical protein P775_07760 [Puniceibacterium antarcticum]|uniref:Uncharacterized protein n=1 Tax=Puniceibacterium antarcticum TaxID=1206336 RepID=A0A2G8RGS1_9RHOB|nr:hypothetical protein [Puniceibacterium antarcticum]PIL20796.1 hypothetical protein P775_07760 [Puniceibacterium antarcticum]
MLGVIHSNDIVGKGDEQSGEFRWLFLLDPVTGPVDELDVTHPRHRRPHAVEGTCDIGHREAVADAGAG